jgi:hypothetical protein
MSRYLRTLYTEKDRALVAEWLAKVPLGWRVEIKETKRTNAQNDRMWHMLTQLSVSLRWHGQKLSPDDWKLVMMAGLNQELRLVPNIHGNGFVQLGRSSSKLSKAEMSDLMELIEAFATERGVELWEKV